MINISICQEKITGWKEGRDGNHYLDITIDTLKQPDNYGNTHTSYQRQSKEERDNKATKVYLGKGKEFIFKERESQAAQTPISQPPKPDNLGVPNTTDSDLPF